MIDIVRDPVAGTDYNKEEDPTLFISEKTQRGPLTEDWLEIYWKEVYFNNVFFIICKY